jgi:hypothetical protein
MHRFGDEELSRAAGRIWSEGWSCAPMQTVKSVPTTLTRPPLSDEVVAVMMIVTGAST